MKSSMDAIEKEIVRYLAGVAGEAQPDLPSAEDFYLYILGELKEAPLEKMLAYLRRNPEGQDFVRHLRRLVNTEPQEATPSGKSLERAKSLVRDPKGAHSCPHCGRSTKPWFYRLWFLLSVVFFSISFAVPRYFIQFVAIGTIFGVAWALGRRATRTQVLIYKALRGAEEDQGVKSRRDGNLVSRHRP